MRELTTLDLEEQLAEQLPARELMSAFILPKIGVIGNGGLNGNYNGNTYGSGISFLNGNLNGDLNGNSLVIQLVVL